MTHHPHQNKDFAKMLWFSILCAVVAVWLILHLSSCTTQRQAVNYMDKHTLISSEYCSAKYPCKDSVHESIEYREGETITVHDSLLQLLHDTTTNIDTRTVLRVKTVTHTDTVERTRVIYQTDKALCASLQLRLDASVNVAKDYQATANKWRKWCLWTWGIIIVLVAASCVRLYLKMIKP